MDKAYESKASAADEARGRLGETLHHVFQLARGEMIAKRDRARAAGAAGDAASDAADLEGAAKALRDTIYAMPASGGRLRALERARGAVAEVEALRSTLGSLASGDVPVGGRVPELDEEQQRREFIRIATVAARAAGLGREIRDVEAASWAHFSIGCGIEKPAADEPGSRGRTSKQVFQARCSTWRNDLATVMGDK